MRMLGSHSTKGLKYISPFYFVTQDIDGDVSAPSSPMSGEAVASALVTTPSTWPINPNAPSGCSFKIQ